MMTDPTPWTVERAHGISIKAANNHHIANMVEHPADDGRALANAKLIVAAVNLVNATARPR